MFVTKMYMVDGVLSLEPPTDPNVEYSIYFSLAARNGYILQNIFTNERANRLTVAAGCETFWREVLLAETK